MATTQRPRYKTKCKIEGTTQTDLSPKQLFDQHPAFGIKRGGGQNDGIEIMTSSGFS